MTTLSTATNDQQAQKPMQLWIDILIVVATSVVAFGLENLAFSEGRLPFGEQIRGAFSVVCGAVAAVSVVFARGGSFTELGLRVPASWTRSIMQALVILFVFVLAQAVVPMMLALFIDLPAADFSRYDVIAGNLPAAISMALILPITASIPEEIIYRGFLMGRLTEFFGKDSRGSILTVLVQAIIFGSIHFQWGLGGMIMTVIMGVVWGTAFILCGRNLWVVILAHSAGHLLFVSQLYFAVTVVA